MVVRHSAECSWCYFHGREGVPAIPIHVSIAKKGGLYDLCESCATEIFAPFLAMQSQRGLVRANEQGELAPGWIGNAWPDAEIATVPPGTATVAGRPVRPAVRSAMLTKNGGSVIGDRVNNGGARVRSGPQPKGQELLCPMAPQWCDHPGFRSFAGVLDHVVRKHDGVRPSVFLKFVTECGLCDPPLTVASNQHLGQHAKRVHGDVLPKVVAQGGCGLALVTLVRAAGDPHGTLKAMDAYALTVHSAMVPNSQLALEDPLSDPTPDPNDQLTEGNDSE